MKSACFMDEGRVLVCLSMKVPCFMDERGFEEGCPQNRVVFEGAVPERMRFWAREWVVSGRDGAAGDCVAMVQESWETCSNVADDSGRSRVCCKSGRNAVSYSSLDVGFVWK